MDTRQFCRFCFLAHTSLLALIGAAQGQVTQRVNLAPGGVQSNGVGDLPIVGSYLSGDGRFVAFKSSSSNLVPGVVGGPNVFVRDRLTSVTEVASVDSNGNLANGGSGLYGLCISSDGRFVAFYSEASNLVAGDTNGVADIMVRDRLTGTTERVSVDSIGTQANGGSLYPSISADGRYVVFSSDATNLVPGDTNGTWDVFVHDRRTGATERVSVTGVATEGNGASSDSAISADARFVVFASSATNLVAGDTNGLPDIFRRDMLAGITELASVTSGGVQANGGGGFPAISGDGRFVSFMSGSTNLVQGDTNGFDDIFVRDMLAATTERVSVASDGSQADAGSNISSLSYDGRYVAFASGADNFVPNDTWAWDVFLHDRRTGTTERLSVSTAGQQANGDNEHCSISADGRYVAFRSSATNLVSGDTNFVTDIFLHDRLAAGFTSVCDPGVGNVIPCPCGNQPAGLGRGCDSSAATGGAVLTASGIAYLSLDSLVFTTSGELPAATSILLEGDALLPSGVVFGQGVRCAGGVLKRLYVKSASAGSITAPDLASGDPSVSARCAALGIQIQPGQPFEFLVYYRDPQVLGGCSAMSTFNATQAGSVTWWP